MPKSILIIGNYGAGNLGDDAILAGILEELNVIGYKGAIKVTHAGVKTSTEIYKSVQRIPFPPLGIRTKLRNLIRYKLEKSPEKNAFQKALDESDKVIMGGGGLFTDSESIKAPFIWAILARFVLKANKPLLMYGQSVGPIKNPLARLLTRHVFKRAEIVMVRDRMTKEFLNNLGVSSVLGTDPAVKWVETIRRKIPKKDLILVCLRNFPGISMEWKKMLMKSLKEFANNNDLELCALSMDTREQALYKDKKNDEYIISRDSIFSPHSATEVLTALQKAKLIVSMRLHGVILGAYCSTPTLAISYTNKVKDYFSDLVNSLPISILEISNLSKDNLSSQIKQALGSLYNNAKKIDGSASKSKKISGGDSINTQILRSFLP